VIGCVQITRPPGSGMPGRSGSSETSTSTRWLARVLLTGTLGLLLIACFLTLGCSSRKAVFLGAGESQEPPPPSAKSLLSSWAGSAKWEGEKFSGSYYRTLRVYRDGRCDTESIRFRGLSASLSGRLVAYGVYRLEQPYEQSREDVARRTKLGLQQRDSFQELTVMDVETGQRTVLAVFTQHPELHRPRPGGPPTIAGTAGVHLTCWSGEDVIYAQVEVSKLYRFELGTHRWTELTLKGGANERIVAMRSSPQGKPLAMYVIDDGGQHACLVDAESGQRLWQVSDAVSAPCYSPSGNQLAWVERRPGEGTDWRPAIVVKDLASGSTHRYVPQIDVREGGFSDIWWIRKAQVLVVAGWHSDLYGVSDVGVWQIGADRVRRVGLLTHGLDMFTPL